MEDFNTCEYGAEQKSEGRWRLFRTLMLSAYALYTLAYFVIIYITRIFPLGALIPITLWIIIYFTWRYTKPDYRYLIEKGTMTFFVMFGKKKKIKKTEIKVSSAEAIAPADALKEKISEFAPQKTYSAIPSVSACDVYAALYTDAEGKRCVFYFVATSQALKLLHFYNSKTVVVKTAV